MKVVWQGHLLRIRRKELGLTMREVAEKVGCKRPNISMWEDGKVTPSGDYLVVLAIVLNREPKQFFEIEGGV